MRRPTLVTTTVLVLALAVAPAQATELASAEVSGACNGPDGGGSGDLGAHADDGGAAVDDDPDGAQAAAEACADAAASGSAPGSGSHLAADASAADGALQAGATSVPVSDLATGGSQDAGAQAEASGACRDDYDRGGEDAVGASADTGGEADADGPDPYAIRDAAIRCAANVVPGPGSYLAADASAVNGAVAAEGSTVPVTDVLAGSGVTAEGACYYGDDGGQSSMTLGTSGLDLPSFVAALDAIEACGNAVQDGETPSDGSYVAVGVTVADEDARVSSVTVTDPATGALP